MQRLRQARDVGRQGILGGRHAGHALFDGHARQQHGQVGQRAGIGQPADRQFVGHRQHALGVARGQGVQQAHQMPLVDGAEHAAHGLLGQVAGAIGDGLVGQRQGVAHGAGGRLPDQPQGRHFETHVFLAQHGLQMPDDGVGRHLLQVELEAARQHRHRDLLRIGGRQDELDVRRRLFQRLEHGVERMPGQHVDFVDHVDLEAPSARRVDRLLQELGHFLDAAVRGRVQFEVVDKAPRIDFRARAAHAARLGSDAGFAVERFGQDARQRGLAHAAGAGEQPGVVQALRVERVRQRAHHVILSHEGIERSRPPLAGQYQISHGWIVEPVSRAGSKRRSQLLEFGAGALAPAPRAAGNAKGTGLFSWRVSVENNPVPSKKQRIMMLCMTLCFEESGWRALLRH
ncbi:hypothetical protein LMG1231_04955 [Achromobacter denitrificans]|nr:hypothetical protein LMG1231_04955 [Achromobacter denitrificans]